MVTSGDLINSNSNPVGPEIRVEQIAPLTINSGLSERVNILISVLFIIIGIVHKPLIGLAIGWWIGQVIGIAINSVVQRKWTHRGQRSMTLSIDGVESPGRKLVPWSQLRLVGLYRPVWQMPMASKSKQSIVLNFSDIPDITIDVSTLKSADQIQLFRIISRCAPHRVLSPEVLYMQMQSLLGGAPTTDGFTQIWSDEFDRRFELANHVTLSAGRKIGNGRYTVELALATRMSSSTYLVSDGKGQRFVAKELVVPVGAEEQVHEKLLQQFNREAGILASLSHPLIVAVRDHFVEDGRSYVIMDCVQGTNLRQYVRSCERVEKKTVLAISLQLLEVLSYLHSRNPAVIHRDLTPDNIMFMNDKDEIRVIDFGAANIYSSEGTGTLIGKRGYMPPEQFKGKSSPESDIYAFGSTLLFLLSGEDPPGMCRIPEFSQPIDDDLLLIAKACLQFEQRDRPTVDDLTAQFEALAHRKEGSNEVV